MIGRMVTKFGWGTLLGGRTLRHGILSTFRKPPSKNLLQSPSQNRRIYISFCSVFRHKFQSYTVRMNQSAGRGLFRKGVVRCFTLEPREPRKPQEPQDEIWNNPIWIQNWEVLNRVGVDGVRGIFIPFFNFSSFFLGFFVFVCKNGEYHYDPVCTDPLQNFPNNFHVSRGHENHEMIFLKTTPWSEQPPVGAQKQADEWSISKQIYNAMIISGRVSSNPFFNWDDVYHRALTDYAINSQRFVWWNHLEVLTLDNSLIIFHAILTKWCCYFAQSGDVQLPQITQNNLASFLVKSLMQKCK